MKTVGKLKFFQKLKTEADMVIEKVDRLKNGWWWVVKMFIKCIAERKELKTAIVSKSVYIDIRVGQVSITLTIDDLK